MSEILQNKLVKCREILAAGGSVPLEDRISVAVLADSPTVVTGFGNVCREVLDMLYATGMYSFEIVGINYDGSPHALPYKIYPAFNGLMQDSSYRDVFGRQRYLDLLGEGRFDIAWVLQDSFIVGEGLAERIVETNVGLPADKKFHFIYYFPIDATPKKSWIDKSVMLADFPVVYTKYGYDEVMKLYAVDENSKLKEEQKEKNIEDKKLLENKLNIIYHGCNLSTFSEIEDKEYVKALRERFWGVHKDKFVFMNVNRNQPRKDIFRTMQAFKILLDRRRAKGKDDVYLYLHCSIYDTGLYLIDMGKQLQLTEGDEYAHPDPKIFAASSGFPISVLNELYNASDAIISTTLGEGWGLSLTEGLAVGKPVIAPDHTSIPEILGKTAGGTGERGVIVKTNGTFVQHDDNSRIRPITDVEDLADKMEWVVENRDQLGSMIEKGKEWVKKLEWSGQEVGAKWMALFEQAYEQSVARRALEVDNLIAKALKEKKIGRNDECPICLTKYKHCRHYEQA